MSSDSLIILRKVPWDTAFAIACIGLGSYGLTLVNSSRWNQLSETDGEQNVVGRVERRNGVLRYRANGSPFWHDVSSNQSAAQGDVIFTGEDGVADLKMADGNEVTVHPNSLIVVDVSQQKKSRWFDSMNLLSNPMAGRTSVKLEQGSLDVKVTDSARPLSLVTTQGNYEIAAEKPASLKVSFDDKAKAAELSIVSGESGDVQLKVAQKAGEEPKAITLKPNQMATLNKSGEVKVEEILVRPKYPIEGEKVLVPTGAPVSLQWEQASDKKVSKLRLELRGTQARTQILKKDLSSIDLKLQSGAYEWRVVPITDRRSLTPAPWTSFVLSSFSAPEALSPSGTIQIPDEEDEIDVIFKWKVTEEFVDESAKVEVWKKKGEKPYETFSGRSADEEIALEAGEYRWRVGLLPAGEETVMWGDYQDFVIKPPVEKKKAVEPPPVMAAVEKKEEKELPANSPYTIDKVEILETYASNKVKAKKSKNASKSEWGDDYLNKLPIDIRWKPVLNAKSYEVTLFQDGKQIKKVETKEPNLEWVVNNLSQKGFSYKIAAIMESGQTIASEVKALQVEIAPPRLKEPKSGSQFSLGEAVLLTWEKTVLTDRYQIQVSLRSNFSSRIMDTWNAGNFLPFVSTKKGKYYWRVRGEAKGKKSKWSRASVIIIK